VPRQTDYANAAIIFSAASSRSSSRSFLNGRGMAVRDTTTLPFTVTSNVPFRGFSAFTTKAGAELSKPLTAASSLAVERLNTPQDLHASIVMPSPDAAGADWDAAFGFAVAFLVEVFAFLGTASLAASLAGAARLRVDRVPAMVGASAEGV